MAPPQRKPLPPFKRILLKISGEALVGPEKSGLHAPTLLKIAQQIQALHLQGLEVALVVGGGNIFRGLAGAAEGFNRTTADHMGMLATVMNGLALQSTFSTLGLEARVLSAWSISSIVEPYAREAALHHLTQGRLVICVAGTGNPYFTTDTAAVLRASEMACDVLLKGTKVEGVYSADPETDPHATFYPELTYQQVLTENLRVMDLTAITLAKENQLPLLVFSLQKADGLQNALKGNGRFTMIRD